MSGLDLYEGNTAERMSRLQPTDTVEPAIFEGFLRGTGMEAMRQLARTGRSVAMAGAALPIILDPLLAKDNYSGVTLTDRYFKGMDEIFEPAIKAWTPEPNEVGVAGQVTGTLLTMLPMVMAGGPGQAMALASMQMGTAQDLVQQHGETVPADKAVAAGAVMSAGLGLGIKVPIFGRSLWQRVLLGGAGFNVFQGAAMRGAAGTILEGTPAAEQFKAFDPLELTIDLLLGAGFGGIAHLSPAARAEGEQAWKALEAWGKSLKPSDVDALAVMRQAQHINVDTLPGKPTTPEALNAHVDRVKTAIDQTLRGEPVNVDNVGVREEAPPAQSLDTRLDAFADEAETLRLARPDVGDAPRGTLEEALRIAAGTSWSAEDALRVVDWAVNNGRQDIATALVERANRIAERAAEAKPGSSPGSKNYDRSLAALKERAKEARAEADQIAAAAGVEARGPDFEPVPERFVEAYENGLDLMKEAERIRAEEGLPTPPDPTPPGPSKVYTAVKEAFDKTIGTRLGEDYPDKIAKLVDAGYQAMARRYGKTVDQLLAFRPLRVTDELPGMNGNRGTFDPNNPNILFQEAKPVWYSQLTRQIEGLKQNTAPASQWKSMIDNLKGIKPEEIEWTGLNEWLDIQQSLARQAEDWATAQFKPKAPGGEVGTIVDDADNMLMGIIGKDKAEALIAEQKALAKGKITKQQILDYLNSNGVKVDEVMKGGEYEPSLTDPKIARHMAELERQEWQVEISDDDSSMIAFVDPETGDFHTSDEIIKFAEQGENADLMDVGYAAKAIEKYWGGSGRQEPTKFGASTLQLPGAKPGSYRELLLTLPKREGVVDNKAIAALTTEWNAWREARNIPPVTADAIPRATWDRLTEDEQRYTYDFRERWDSANEAAKREAGVFQSSHFDQPNILAHIRFNERTDAEGKKVLFIEEIQSDWAQKGKKEGFFDPAAKKRMQELAKQYDALTSERRNLIDEMAAMTGDGGEPFARGVDRQIEIDKQMTAMQAEMDGLRTSINNPIPSAPFVGKTDAWVSLAMKRMIRYAAENGFDRIAWTRGEQQVERYTNALRQVVDRIEWEKTPEGVQIVGTKGGKGKLTAAEQRSLAELEVVEDRIPERMTATDRNRLDNLRTKLRGMKVVDTRYGENELSDAIGKTLAEQIKNDPGQKGVIEGNNIRVDDTGMAGFYDRIVPKIANDILKKLGGGKVGEIKLERGKTKKLSAAEAKDIADGLIQGRLDVDEVNAEYGLNIDPDDIPRNDGANITRLVNAFAKEIREGSIPQKTSIQHGFDITPELKAKAMEGLPLFQGGDQPRGYFQPGEGYTLGMLEGANKSTPVHEVGHMFLQLLKDIADQADSPREIRADLDIAFKWLGVDPKQYDAMTFEERRHYHEKWARGFEAYMREGRAPTPELRSVFQRFKEWLLEVYRTLTQLNVKLDDDIRGVFDRLLGAERQLEAGETQTVKSRFLADLQELGGIQKSAMEDITGEKRFGKGIKGVPWGLFKEQGKSVDDLANMMRDRGWPIPEDEVDGGVQVLKDLIRSELEGERAMKTGETPEAKDVTEADAEQIMREAADIEEQAAERFNYQDSPEYRAEVSRIRADRDFQLAKVLQGEDPIGAEARRIVAENPDQTMVFGEGEAMTARDYLDQAQAEYDQALKDAEMYRVAGDCMLGVD